MIKISNPLELLMKQQQAQSKQATKPAKTKPDLATKLIQQRESALEGLTQKSSSKHIDKSLDEVFSDNDILALEAEPVTTEQDKPAKPETTERAETEPAEQAKDRLDFVKEWDKTLAYFDKYAVSKNKLEGSWFGIVLNKIFDDENISNTDQAVYIYLSSHSVPYSKKIRYINDFSAAQIVAIAGLNQRSWHKKIESSLNKLKKYKYILLNETFKVGDDQHYQVKLPGEVESGFTKIESVAIDKILTTNSSSVFSAISLYTAIKRYIWETVSNTPVVYQTRSVLIKEAKISRYKYQSALKLLIDNHLIASFVVRKAGTGGRVARWYSDYKHLDKFKEYIKSELEAGVINDVSLD